MTDSEEKLSYLLDDRPGEKTAAAIDDVAADVNLQYRLRRYRMIGEVMRNELPAAIDTGFHASVMARLRDEIAGDSPSQADTLRLSAWNWSRFKPFAGLAVAASVALVTVALWQPLQPGGDGELVSAQQERIEQLAGQAVQGSAVPVSTSAHPLGLRWKVDRDQPGLQQKLNAYLVNHTEYSNSVQGLIPQARVAGYDAQQ